MRYFYHLIVLYLTVHIFWHLIREKSFWKKAGIVLVLIMFLLRLFLVE